MKQQNNLNVGMELEPNIKTEVSKVVESKRKKGAIVPYLWLIPSVALIFSVVLYPIYELFITAFSEISLSGVRRGFNGLTNFLALFENSTFLMVLWNTFVWTVAVVVVSTVLSLGIGVLLNQDFKGRRLVRSALIIPWAVSLIITSVIWKWILDNDFGALNQFLKKLHIIEENIFWLASPSTSFPAMIWVGIFVTIPFTSFVILSALQSISKSLYEAASVDGANNWQQFYKITLPQLKPALTVCTVLNTIYVFNSFPIVWSITKGDPINQTDLVITYLYKLAFQVNRMGEAAAVSVISFLILLIFAIVYLIVIKQKEAE